MSSFPRPTDTDLSHADRLCAAAARVLAGVGEAAEGREAIARLLATQVIVDRADLERTNLYRAFAPQEAGEQSHDRFVRNVIEYVLQERFLFDAAAIEMTGDELGIRSGSPEEAHLATRELAQAEFLVGADGSSTSEDALGFRAAMTLWALDGDDELVRQAMRAAYASGTARAADFYDRVLDSWGCGLVEPFTSQDVAVILTSLVDGMLIRSRFDPGAVDPGGELFASTVATFISALLRPKGEPGTTALDRFTIITTTADRDAAARAPGNEDETRERIRAAAETLFRAAADADRDPRAVPLEAIASEAGCSTTTLERLWDGPSLLLLDYFYSEIEERASAHEGISLGDALDRLSNAAHGLLEEPPSDDRDQLYLRLLGRMLYETAQFAADDRLIVGAALAAIEFGAADGSGSHLRSARDSRRHRAIRSRFELAIDAGQRMAVIRDEKGLYASELGNLLPVTVLHQVIRQEKKPAQEVAEMIYDTLLRGLVARPGQVPAPRAATRQPIPGEGSGTRHR